MTSAFAKTKDSPFPPMTPHKMRIYSMRFCPYAQRSRMVLEHYKVPFETVNISLRSKPTWFFDKNPFGTVPAYEKDGTILFESRVLCDYIDEIYGKGALYPTDPLQKARAKILMENTSRYTSPYYKLLFAKTDEPKLKEYAEDFNKSLKYFEDQLEAKFFNGESVGMVDYYLWPHLERVGGLAMVIQLPLMPKDKFPKLNAWVSAMKSTPGVKATLFSDEDHKGFTDSVKAGNANYDYGL